MLAPIDDLSDLRPYQAAYVRDHAFDVARYLAWEPRLGKTRAEVRAIERRIAAGARRILVIAPQKALELTWRDEIAMRGIFHLDLSTGPVVARMERLRAHRRSPNNELPTIITINFDVLERKVAVEGGKIKRVSDYLADWLPQDIIVDEAHLIKSAGAGRTYALRRLSRFATCRRMLSGTPDPQGYIDFYAQFLFLDPTVFDGTGTDVKGRPITYSGTRKSDFLAQYAMLDPFTNQIICYRDTDKLLAKIAPYMDRQRARDWFPGTLEMPDIVRDIPWPTRARKLYNTLKTDHILTGDDHGISINAAHKLTRLLRHQQLCAGFLADETEGAEKELHWFHEAKIEALISDLEEIVEADRFVVVPYSYTPSGEKIAAACRRRFGADRVALINGHTHERVATETLRLFDVNSAVDTPIRILILQEQVGGVGISLARAQHMIFYSWTMDYAVHEQMRKRIWDPARPAFYTYLQMHQSADGFAKAIIKNKHNGSIMQNATFNIDLALQGTLAA